MVLDLSLKNKIELFGNFQTKLADCQKIAAIAL